MENLKQTLFFDHETEKEKKSPISKDTSVSYVCTFSFHLTTRQNKKEKQNPLHLLDLCSFSQRKENPNTHFTRKE